MIEAHREEVFQQAASQMIEGNNAEAKGLLSVLVEQSPREPKFRYLLGMALRHLGNKEDALRELLAAVEHDPANSEYWFQLALTQEAVGNSENALSSINQAIRLHPSEARFRYQRSIYYEAFGNVVGAIEDCRFSVANAPAEAWFIRLAKLLQKSGDFLGALQSCRSALAASPTNTEALRYLAELLKLSGDRKELMTALHTVFTLETAASGEFRNLSPPSGSTPKAQAALYYGMFEVHRQFKRTTEATECLYRAVELDSENGRYQHHLGNCLQDLGKLAEALYHHCIAVEVDSLEPAYQHHYAVALAASGHETLAISVAKAAARRFASRPEIASFLGHLLFKRSDFAGAAESYLQAINATEVLNWDQAIDFAVSAFASGQLQVSAAMITRLQNKDLRSVNFSISVDTVDRLQDANQGLLHIGRDHLNITFLPSLQRANPAGLKFTLVRFFESCPLFFYLASVSDEATKQFRLFLGDIGGTESDDMSFCSQDGLGVLIPDHVFIRSDAFRGFKDEVDRCWKPWDDREPLAFWRGTSTGLWQGEKISPTGDILLHNLPRLKLCQISLSNPGLLDARVATILQIDDPRIVERIKSEGLLSNYVETVSFLNYKVQIDIDGNSNSWAGFYQKLVTGSPVLKVGSYGRFQQWFYGRLIEWENFVPVLPDMSDLVDKIVYILERPELAKQIGGAGRRLAISMTLQHEFNIIGRSVCIGDRPVLGDRSRGRPGDLAGDVLEIETPGPA